jgi:hypothetical protein
VLFECAQRDRSAITMRTKVTNRRRDPNLGNTLHYGAQFDMRHGRRPALVPELPFLFCCFVVSFSTIYLVAVYYRDVTGEVLIPGCCALAVAVLLSLICAYVFEGERTKWFKWGIVLLNIAPPLFTAVYARSVAEEARTEGAVSIFKAYVMDPIPPSVTDLHIEPALYLTLTFGIRKLDLDGIITTGNYAKLDVTASKASTRGFYDMGYEALSNNDELFQTDGKDQIIRTLRTNREHTMATVCIHELH